MANLPIENPHPVLANPVTVRNSAALHVGGGWDAATIEIACAGMRWIMFYLTYTRGAAGGAFDMQIECSPYSADQTGVENWFQLYCFDGGTLTAGADVRERIQRAIVTYQATGALAEKLFWGPYQIEGVVERLRVNFRESGVVGTPGSLHAVALFYQ